MHLLGRSCLGCGAFSVADSLFCSICWEFDLKQLMSAPQNHCRTPQGFAHTYLFRWRPKESDGLSALILALKEHRLEATFDFYAKHLLRRVFFEGSEILIPAPSTNPKRRHAHNLAKSIARRTGLMVQDPLIHPEGFQQKGRSKTQRRALQFTANENLTWSMPQAHSPPSKIVFVDDVLTTGSTAMAAYRALGCPTNFVVLSLLYREPLAAPVGV